MQSALSVPGVVTATDWLGPPKLMVQPPRRKAAASARDLFMVMPSRGGDASTRPRLRPLGNRRGNCHLALRGSPGRQVSAFHKKRLGCNCHRRAQGALGRSPIRFGISNDSNPRGARNRVMSLAGNGRGRGLGTAGDESVVHERCQPRIPVEFCK